MEALAIAPDTVVTLSYALFDEHGELVDRAGIRPDAGSEAGEGEPLTYVHGYAQLVPGLERQIEGLKPGERGVFTVEADEAFGEHDDDAVFAVDRSDFPDASSVAVGDEFMAEGPDGEPIAMRVLEVHADAFVVDTNHPLAGQRVRFEVEVSAVRAAAEEEIAAAQAELERAIADDDDACGCGHDHAEGHDHDHGQHDHDHTDVSLIQLGKKS
jgi:FKBP-type peptidyl-prolyl cis-trans isomerase SlyD